MSTATNTPETKTPTVIRVKLDKLAVHPVARRENYSEADLKPLGRSIKENGQLHPVLVREHDGRLELLAGTRRMKAAQSVGIKTLNATVCHATDAQALELIGVENLLRSDLNPLERSRYVIELMRPQTYGGGGLSLDEVKKRFGHTEDWVRKTCKLSRLPEPWRSDLAVGKISEAVVQALFPYLDKPAVLKSIERHQERHPKLWGGREDWQRLARIIDAKFTELDQEEGWSESTPAPNPDRESSAALVPDPSAEERIERQAETVEKALTGGPDAGSNGEALRRRLTAAAARRMIKRVLDSTEDLKVVQRVVQKRLGELEVSDDE